MKKVNLVAVVTLASLLSAAPPAVSDAPGVAAPAVASSVKLVLGAYGSRLLVHDKPEPLVLQLYIINPAAIRAEAINRCARNLQGVLQQPGANIGLSQQAQTDLKAACEQIPIKTVTLGSDKKSVRDLITFSVVSANANQTVPVDIEPLANRPGSSPRPMTLMGKNRIKIQYGIGPASLSSLPNGKYVITARLDTSNGANETVQTDSVIVNLKDKLESLSDEEMQTWLYNYGRYYVDNKQYDQAKAYVERLLAVDPNSVAAASLQGDSCYEQGQWDDAVKAYKLALTRDDRKSESSVDREGRVSRYLLGQLAAVAVAQKKMAEQGSNPQ